MWWLVALAGAMWVATWRLGTASTVNDEVAYRQAAAAMARGDWTRNDQHPPLAKELIALAGAVGSHVGAPPLVADRLVGAACFLITGLLLGALAARVGAASSGRATALVAAVLWWGLPLAPGVLVGHVDRYALLEGPMITAMAAAALAAAHLADQPPNAERIRDWGGWVLLGGCLGAATACKLLGALIAPVALVPAVVVARCAGGGARRAAGGLALAAGAAVAVLAASYAPMGGHAWPALQRAVTYQLHHARVGHLQTVDGRAYRFPPPWAPLWFQEQYLGASAAVALWAAALAGVVALAVRRARASGAVPVLAVAVIGVAVAVTPIKLPQYHDALVPFLDVLAAVGVVRLAGIALPRDASRVRLGPRAVAAALAIALVVPLAWRAGLAQVALARLQPGDYRAAAAVLWAHGVTGPVVVWGDGPALAAQGYPVDVTRSLPPDCRPIALVTDATSIHRLRGVDAARWRRTCGAGYERVSLGRVTVYLRPRR